MQTYRIHEIVETDRNSLEMILGIVVLAVLIACGLASVPIPSRVASEEPVPGLRQERRRMAEIQELRTRNETLNGELSRLTKALETTQANLASFRTLHDHLVLKVDTATAKLQEVENSIEDTKSRAGKLDEYATLHAQLTKERDEALAQAQSAADRIRDLTLKLQRAGVYP
jgi:DNA repair exonuclease SbcCD ATPase subunit